MGIGRLSGEGSSSGVGDLILPRLRRLAGLGRAKAPKGEKEEGACDVVGLRFASGVEGAEGSAELFLRCVIGLGIPEGMILLACTVCSGSSLPESDESDGERTRSEWRRLCFLRIGGVI